MYHHQGPHPFPNRPRPPPNQQQNRPPSGMVSQVMGFQFPRPTQLPDELESALSIRGSRDMDHRLMEHIDRPNQHQNQGSGSGMSQHVGYSSNLPDNQKSQQPGVDWTNYQPPSKLFANAPPSTGHQSHHGQQQPGTSLSAWNAPISDSPSPQIRHAHSGGGDGQGLYTPESAGSILASFGLSNEDLEVLSHYPDDQLTPDTLPFILRDIQINKSGKSKNAPPASSSSFPHSVGDMQLPPSHSSPMACSNSQEVPSLLTVTQTAGKIIDYGHASRAKDDSSTRETFKRERLSSERAVKVYPTSSSAPKLESGERRQVRLEPTESSKHGDRDYRRTSSEHQRSSRSPAREFSSSSKSRHQDRDYTHERPKPRPVSETRSEDSSLSRRPVSKPHSSTKKLPTPTMRSDFSAMPPKVYPHTCSICEVQCDQEKDWISHINTVNHTAACRGLRNNRSGRYGSRDANVHIQSPSRSPSWSPGPSLNKHKLGHDHRHHGRTATLHHSPRHHHKDYDHRFGHQHSSSRSPSHSYRPSSRNDDRDSSGGSSHSGLKRPHYDSVRRSTYISQHPSSIKRPRLVPGELNKTLKPGAKGALKTAKTAAGKDDSSGKSQLVKKKKKVVAPEPRKQNFIHGLVYLTGIPKDATEQEVTDLVGSFGKINNVILLPCSEEDTEKDQGQKASVCMIKGKDAQALAQAPNLSIRDQVITASLAETPEPEKSCDGNDSKPSSDLEKGAAEEFTGSHDTEQKISDEMGLVMITGLPQDGWSEDDINKLAEPFGTPSDLIISRQNGKVLVYMSDMETAEEMVKVHTFMPPKIKECSLNVMHIKQRITSKARVAIYNLLMGSLDPLEGLEPVNWKSLIVIENVPSSSSSDVQKLVRRFGTVIKTLVLNDMVICEMATADMALSVCKRFQKFPCIIQNNPLYFSRKPDRHKAQPKFITSFLNSSKDTPANGKDEETTTSPVKDECEAVDNTEPLQEQKEKDELEELNAAEDQVEIKKTDEEKGNADIKNQEATIETEIQTSENISPKETCADDLSTDGNALSADGNALSADGNALSADGNALSADGNALSADGNALSADGNALSADGNALSADGNAPSADGNAPSADGKAPSADGNAPSADGNAPSADGNAPSADGNAPSADGNAPSADGNAPSADGNAPSADGNAPSADGNAPSADGNAPSADGNAPSADGNAPSADGNAPSADGNALSASGHAQATDEMKPNSCGGEVTSVEPVIPELPKVTPEMVKALIVECRTRTASQASKAVAVEEAGGRQEMQTEPVKTDKREKSSEKTKVAVKNHREEEVKRQEERKEREGRREREKERREREREEKARKEKEREERIRRDRDRRERERRERQDRQRRGRKRAYDDGSLGSRSRHDAPRGRDEYWKNDKNKEEEEEQFDDFPFNMSDFVTVDEVGDVNDLPCAPMETTEEEEEDGAHQSAQPDATQDTPMEVVTETTNVNDTPSESEGQTSEGKAEVSDPLLSSDSPPDSECLPTQMPEPSQQQDTLDAEAGTETEMTTVDSKPEVKHTSMSAPPPNVPAESPTNSTTTGVSMAESEEDAVGLIKTDMETDNQDTEETKDHQDTEETKDHQDTEETKDHQDTEETKDHQDTEETKDHQDTEETKDHQDTEETKDHQDTEETKDHQDTATKDDQDTATKDDQDTATKDDQDTATKDDQDTEETTITDVAAAETEKEEMLEGSTNTGHRKIETAISQDSLPPFNPNNPIEKEEMLEGSTNTGHRKSAVSQDALLPFNPNNPIGLEFLVPKTGFLCKVCNRFFCGNKQVEMNHCKTLKHYENLQKYLQRMTS